MIKFYLLSLFISWSMISVAQVAVTSTAGSPGPIVYPTLKLAFDAINAGTHKDVINILVSGNTTETVTAVLSVSGSGPSLFSSVSIRPAGGGARIITGDIAGTLIDLDGADNVTIDGINSDGNTLTISNLNTSAGNTSTIRFINDATSNLVQNVNIEGSATSVTLGTILFSSAALTGNNNNTITACNISEAGGNFPVNSIYSAGTPGQDNTNNIISNNNISNFFNPALATAGIILSTGNSSWIITGNKFFQTTARIFTAGATQRVIQVSSGNNYSITGNIIGYASALGTGNYVIAGAVTTRFIAIDLAVGSVASSVQNNTVTAFNFTSSSGASTVNGIWCAINISSGNVNVGTIAGNLVGSNTGTGAVLVTPTVAGPSVVGITSASTGTIIIANNSIGGIDLLPSGVFSGSMVGIQTQGASGTVTVTNNTVGNATANNMRVGLAGTTTGSGIIRGIINANAGAVTISSNTIRNLTHYSSSTLGLFRGIEYQNGTGTISENSISNVTAFGTSASVTTHEGIGLIVTSTLPGIVIDGNRIYNLSLSSTTANAMVLSGIYLGTVNGITILRNTLYDFVNAGTSVSATAPCVIAGVFCRDANVTNPLTIANNMISFGNLQITNTAIIGVWNQQLTAANYTLRLYYNSINIEGTTSGAQPSFGYYRGDFSAGFTVPTVDIKNNIFTNARTGGSGKHYAIANSYPSASSSSNGWGANASNFNVLNANPATIGYWSADRDFASWKTASASDMNSLSGITITYYNSASDLHLANNSNALLNGAATPIAGVTTDMDNDLRSASNPDIGADEFTPSGVVAVTLEYFTGRKSAFKNDLSWKASCSSSGVHFNIEKSRDGRQFTSIYNLAATRDRCAEAFNFADNHTFQGSNYYRLKMTEPDGTISYSPMVTIINKPGGLQIVNLYPAFITQGSALLNVESDRKKEIQLYITDMSGRLIQNQSAQVSTGTNSITLNVTNLAGGVYQLSVYAPGEMKTTKFIKQ